jgi:hypothetical protein
LNTEAKKESMVAQENEVHAFIRENCFAIDGTKVTVAAFYDSFMAYLGSGDKATQWSKQAVGRVVKMKFPSGRVGNVFHYGNITLDAGAVGHGVYIEKGGVLHLMAKGEEKSDPISADEQPIS